MKIIPELGREGNSKFCSLGRPRAWFPGRSHTRIDVMIWFVLTQKPALPTAVFGPFCHPVLTSGTMHSRSRKEIGQTSEYQRLKTWSSPLKLFDLVTPRM